MDLLNGSSTSTTSCQQEVELLEECWFFENLLICSSKPKMSRCNSDPCPSTTFDAITTNQQQFLISNNVTASSTSSTMNSNSKLVRAPSLPTSFMDAKTVPQNGRHDSGGITKLKPQVPPPQHTLLRAPSLPAPCINGREEENDEEEEDQESEFRLGRLIRQASLNSSDTSLPPRLTSQNTSIPRRPRKKVLVDGNKKMGHQYQINQTKKGKLIQEKEVERALSSQFAKQSLEDEVSMYKVAGLQEKCWGEQEEKNIGKPYNLKRSSSTIPKWAAAAAENDKRSPQDMKAQIKFWARAVASNARAPGVL